MFLAAFAAVLSCKKPLFDSTPRWYGRGGPRSVMVAPVEPVDSSALDLPPKKGVYITALCFPSWAKWQEGDFRDARAVLFRDNVEIASAPAGPRPDADRIHLLKGHLWNDIADEGVTRIYRDGTEVLTLPDEELLRGFLAEGADVYTLGQRPGGAGICYRVNGEEVFSTKAGSILGGADDRDWEGGAFCRDSTGIYYVYGIPIHQGEKAVPEYHIMKGAEEIGTASASKDGAIYDIRVFDGVVYRTERRNSSPQSFCIVMDKMYLAQDIGLKEESLHLCKLFSLSDEVAVKGFSDGESGDFFWIRDRSGLRWATSAYRIREVYLDGGISAFVVSDGGLVSRILKDFTTIPVMPMKYRLTNTRCADFRDGFFAAALSNPDGQEHLVIMDSDTLHLRFNGYFTSLNICL